jgi:SAM-dependent methyltransferase
MTDVTKTEPLSHTISPESLDDCIQKISARIRLEGDKPYVTVTRQLELLEQLAQFDLGRFLLQNQGLNGYWTHYILTYPWFGRLTGLNNRGEQFSQLEKFILDRAPGILATQQRFENFLQENQRSVVNGAKLACIPCGMMGELLYLNYKEVTDIQLVGIDIDNNTLADATDLAEKQGLSKYVNFRQGNAWQLDYIDEFDLISSNGLNIYELDNERITALYRNFFMALKPGGRLVTSYLTCPPNITTESEWDITMVHKDDMLLQRIIFSDVINAKWQCYRSTDQTKSQLEYVGFSRFYINYDEARMFPTIVAYKP